jgi:hypothetical protein
MLKMLTACRRIGDAAVRKRTINGAKPVRVPTCADRTLEKSRAS